jgi:transposase
MPPDRLGLWPAGTTKALRRLFFQTETLRAIDKFHVANVKSVKLLVRSFCVREIGHAQQCRQRSIAEPCLGRCGTLRMLNWRPSAHAPAWLSKSQAENARKLSDCAGYLRHKPILTQASRSQAAGAKGGEWAQAVGRSRGGRTSKIHCLADDRGRPVAFALTPGNVADISMAMPLLAAIARPNRLIADKAYDADSLRSWLKIRRIQAVIPSTATRTVPYPLDRAVYRRRNLIERLFCRLKNWRRLATRYDRLARNYLAALALVAAVTEWI